MSLAGDFGMYYQGTVVFVNDGGEHRPFIINSVDGRETLSSLRFFGNVITDEEGRTRRAEFDHDDIDFSLPEIGWRRVNGVPRWITYKTVKTVRKGLHPIRLSNFGENDFTRANIWQLTQTFEGRISDDWCIIGEDLMFKGFKVGVVTGENSVTLVGSAEYLIPRLERLRPNYQINVE